MHGLTDYFHSTRHEPRVPLTFINMKLVIWPLAGGMHEQLHQLAYTLNK